MNWAFLNNFSNYNLSTIYFKKHRILFFASKKYLANFTNVKNIHKRVQTAEIPIGHKIVNIFDADFHNFLSAGIKL